MEGGLSEGADSLIRRLPSSRLGALSARTLGSSMTRGVRRGPGRGWRRRDAANPVAARQALARGSIPLPARALQELDVAQLPWRSCVKWSGSGEGQGAARFSRRTRPRWRRSKSTGDACAKLLGRPVKVASYHPDANNYETVMQVVCREVHTTFKR